MANKPRCEDPTHEKRKKSNGVMSCYTCLKAHLPVGQHVMPRVGKREDPAREIPYTWGR